MVVVEKGQRVEQVRQLTFIWDGVHYVRVLAREDGGDAGPPYYFKETKFRYAPHELTPHRYVPYESIESIVKKLAELGPTRVACDLFVKPLLSGPGTVVDVECRNWGPGD